MKKETENWLKIARYELKVAESLLKDGLYLKVIEHSHASLEKLIKGIITEQNKSPQRIHSLLKLVSTTLIENVDDNIKTILKELDRLYISVRYPDDIDYIQSQLPKAEVEKTFSKVKEIYKMLEKSLK